MSKKKIIIAEDEKSIAKILAAKLNKSGYDAQAVFNGKELVEKLEQEKFDLILLDLIMPQMDGFQVLEHMNQKKIKVPVIVSTNLGQKEDEDQVRKLGAVDYLVKANNPLNEVLKKVEKYLSK